MSTLHGNRIKMIGRCCSVWVTLLTAAASAQIAFGQYSMPGMMPYVPRSQRTNNNNPNSNQNSQNRNMQTPFQGTATITGVGSLGLEVIDANGNKWRVVPEKKTCKIEVTGNADPSFLKPDMLVRYNAAFDKKGNATAAVNELEIISPLMAMSATSMKNEMKVGEAIPNGEMTGHIKSIKNNHFSVQNTNGTFSADLAPNAVVKVDVSEPQWVQAGDKVDVKGYYSQQGVAIAQEMHITLSNTLGEPVKKKTGTKASGTAATANK
jgi:hypothetical protein